MFDGYNYYCTIVVFGYCTLGKGKGGEYVESMFNLSNSQVSTLMF